MTQRAAPDIRSVVRTDAYLSADRMGSSGDVVLLDAGVRHGEFASAYENRFQAAIDAGESIYGEMPPLTRAAHERRMALLDALDVGDLSDSVVVDFGVGNWGVACIAPKLQGCALAVGIDISEHAIRESARVSAEGTYPYGAGWVYLVSDGRSLELHDESVDVFFGGEVIEHIDHTDAWLDEVHRVLRPGGTLILTTPNANAVLYAARDEEWCVGAEHVALMSYEELVRRLAPRFRIVVAHGFNMSFDPSVDHRITDATFTREWAACCLHRPDLANGVIVQCRRRDEWRRPAHEVSDIPHQDGRLRWHGAWVDVDLHPGLTGRMGLPGALLAFDFTGTECIVQFWAHAWSGVASVEVDGVPRRIDLYDPAGGFRRLVIEGLADTPHAIVVHVTGERRPAALHAQVVVHHILAGRSSPAPGDGPAEGSSALTGSVAVREGEART